MGVIVGHKEKCMGKELIDARRNGNAEVAEEVVKRVTRSVGKKFNEGEILLLFDGSISSGTNKRPSPIRGLSDIDITAVIYEHPNGNGNVNIEKFIRLNKAVYEAITNLDKHNIRIIASHDYQAESALQGTVKKSLILDCVFFPSIDAIPIWSNIRLQELDFAVNIIGKGKLLFGDPSNQETLLNDLIDKNKLNGGKIEMTRLEKAIVTSEKILVDANVLLVANKHIPMETLVFDTLKKMKIIVVNVVGSKLKELSGAYHGSISEILASDSKNMLPKYMLQFTEDVSKAREADDISKKDLIKLHRKAAEMIKQAADTIKQAADTISSPAT